MLIVLSTPTSFNAGQSKTISFNINSVRSIEVRKDEANGDFMVSINFGDQWYGISTYQNEEHAIVEANNIIKTFEHGDKVYRIEAKTIRDTLKDTENNETT